MSLPLPGAPFPPQTIVRTDGRKWITTTADLAVLRVAGTAKGGFDAGTYEGILRSNLTTIVKVLK